MGGGEDIVKDMIFEALKSESLEHNSTEIFTHLGFEEKLLPENALPLIEWSRLIEGELEEQIGDQFVKILSYLISRGFDNPFEYDFYWTPSPGYIDRVIIPFRYQGKIVGNTARKITEGKPKYLSDQHPQFVFNFDSQQEGQKY
jgi:hypothetical protein